MAAPPPPAWMHTAGGTPLTESEIDELLRMTINEMLSPEVRYQLAQLLKERRGAGFGRVYLEFSKGRVDMIGIEAGQKTHQMPWPLKE